MIGNGSLKVILDKAGKQYWNKMWEETAVPEAANPHACGFSAIYVRRMHQLFRKMFATASTEGRTLVELGCGASVWLPYFAREFGFRIAGIDYSESGCEQARRILQKAHVAGEVACADFFKPPVHLVGAFDYAYSAGVVEHFIPTDRCIRAFAAFLRPGGTMITIIPSMSGAVGSLQKFASRSVYEIHVPLTAQALKAAHEKAGLDVVSCEYFLSVGFGVVNVAGLPSPSTAFKRLVVRFLAKISVLVWALEDKFGQLRTSRLFSPQIVCVARKR